MSKHSKLGIKKGHCRRHGELNEINSIQAKEKYGIRVRCKICRRENQAILEFNRRNGTYKDRRFNENNSKCEKHGVEKNKENYYVCNKCANERKKKRYDENVIEHRTRAVLQNHKKINLTREIYIGLFERQKGLCKICNNPEKRKCVSGDLCRLAVDHCHITGKIRSLLCHDCNTGIGKFRDSKELLQKAIDYLNEHKT